MSPPYRFEVQYDEAIVRQSAWRFVRRRLGGRWWVWAIVLTLTAVHFVSVALSGDWGFVTAFLAAAWVVLTGIVLAGWLIHRRAGLRKLRALDAMRASFTFDESGITVASKLGSTHLVWQALDEVWTYPRFWIVTTAANAYFTLPIETASPDALAFARSKLCSRLT